MNNTNTRIPIRCRPCETYIESSIHERTSRTWVNTNLIFKLLMYGVGVPKDKNSRIAALIEAGCDVRATNKFGETLLHRAAKGSTVENAEMLIKCGADVNAQTAHAFGHITPLFKALVSNNSKGMICMLLYYGANVNTVDRNGCTPYSTRRASERARLLLLDFVDEDQGSDDQDATSDLDFEDNTCRVLMERIRLGANINYIDRWHKSPLTYSLCEKSADFFKFLFPRTNPRILTKFYQSLLRIYKLGAGLYFTPEEWLECLYLILSSPAAQDLVEDYRQRDCFSDFFRGLYGLLKTFRDYKIERKDRVALISMILSLNATIDTECIELVHEYFGFNEELEAILYCGNICDGYSCMGDLLCATKENASRAELFEFFKYKVTMSPEYVTRLLGFFWLPLHMKEDLIFLSLSCNNIDKVIDKLASMPEVPILIGLSRDATRTFIQRKFNVTQPHHFYIVV